MFILFKSQKKCIYENNDNLPLLKKQKKIEAYKKLYALDLTDLKGKTIFFPNFK